MQAKPDKSTANQQADSQLDRLEHFAPLGETIAGFWLEPRNRKTRI